MSTLSLAVASGQGVLASPSTVVSGSVSSVHITWISEADVSPGDPYPTASTESPVLSAIAPTPPPHPLAIILDAPIDPQPTTQIFTLTVTKTLTITVPASPSSSPPAPPPPSRNVKAPIMDWQNPKKMDDLSAFNISAFSGGKNNLEVVQGIPASVASTFASMSSTEPEPESEPEFLEQSDQSNILASHRKPQSQTRWKDVESSIQLFYPAGSINPAQKPVGGTQFYATPLDLMGARNVSLGYSVFFPKDFDWVLGGKMPGLYGGHAGCSGGNAALDCWSTRLMWRKAGKGELYLYAPKDKQTDELCNDPQSVCDAKYGFSIGRGSFDWAAGRWTSVLQTVTLNTPGKQDGCFTLDVNGERVLDRCDIFYRDDPSQFKGHTSSDQGGGLGGLLGTLLSDLFRREPETGSAAPVSTSALTTTALARDGAVQYVPLRMYEAQQGWAIQTTSGGSEAASTSTTAGDPQPTAPPDSSVQENGDGTVSTESHNPPPIGFKGLFFSSFFGGHGARYATPTDQHVWFKDFSMSYNS